MKEIMLKYLVCDNKRRVFLKIFLIVKQYKKVVKGPGSGETLNYNLSSDAN